MTKGEFAEAVGLALRQVDNLVLEAGFPRTKVGRSYDYGAVAVVWSYERKLERERGKRPALNESQERFDAARAEKAELERGHMEQMQGAQVEGRRGRG